MKDLLFSGRFAALAPFVFVIAAAATLINPAALIYGGALLILMALADRFSWKPWVPLAIVAALMLLAPVLAFAADGAPETVAQAASEGSKVVWGWGETAQSLAKAVAWVLASAAMILLRRLPQNLVAIFGNARVELLLNNAIGYGLNAVAGAVKGKTLEVDVGNKVLAQALQYAVDNAPAWLQSWAGGPEGLAKKIWARLNLGEGADDTAISSAVAQVNP